MKEGKETNKGRRDCEKKRKKGRQRRKNIHIVVKTEARRRKILQKYRKTSKAGNRKK